MHEIKLINDSVAYSPFPIPKPPGDGRVKAVGEEDAKQQLEHTTSVSSQVAPDPQLS